jgi:hypothetical protein
METYVAAHSVYSIHVSLSIELSVICFMHAL